MISTKRVGKVDVVRVTGEISLGGGGLARPLDLQGQQLVDVGDTLTRLFGGGSRHILIDLGGVSFIDSAGFGELVACKKRARERGGDVKILQPAERVRALLVMTLLSQVFEILEDEETAVASF